MSPLFSEPYIQGNYSASEINDEFFFFTDSDNREKKSCDKFLTIQMAHKKVMML